MDKIKFRKYLMSFGFSSFIVFFGIMILVFLTTPTMFELYSDTGVQLPALSAFHYNVTQMLLQYWYLLIPLIVVIFLSLSVFASYFTSRRNTPDRWVVIIRVIWSVIWLILLGGLMIAIFLPSFNLPGLVS